MDQLVQPSQGREAIAGGPSGSQAVDRALMLLALVGRQAERGAALSAIVAESGFNKPTARRLLVALMRAGLVEQDEASRRYFLGEEAYVLGTLASHRYGLLELAMESLRNLSAASADTAFLSMRREHYSVCLHRQEGTHPVRTHALQAGNQHPLGVGAGSLAMLSALPDAEVERILAETSKVLFASYPGYSPQIIRQDVAATRSAGYALNPGRVVSSSWGIGLAIRFPDGRIAGALSMAAIDSRMQGDRQCELALLLKGEIARVEGKLARMFTPASGRDGHRTRRPAAATRLTA